MKKQNEQCGKNKTIEINKKTKIVSLIEGIIKHYISTIQVFFIIILVLLFALIYTTPALAAPIISSMSGTVADGESVMINGGSFGVHEDFGNGDNFLNYLFEDCEAGTIDATTKEWAGWAPMTTANNRQGSFFNVFHEKRAVSTEYKTVFGTTASVSYRYSIRVNVQDAAPVHNYFISQWIRLSDDFGNISASTVNQVKFLMTTPFDTTGNKDYFQTRGNTPPPLRTETESGELSQSHGDLESCMPYGTWHRMDMWVSVPDATTGGVDEIKWWVDGKLIREAKQTDGHLQPNPEDVHKVGWVSFIGYIDNSSDVSFSLQTDDHFLDFTMARVEICDNLAWDDTIQKHCEIQLPTSWSPTSINFTFNQGSFNTGDTAYLFVVDENGAVNETGFPITIGNSNSNQYRADVDNNSQINTTDAMLTLRNSLGLDMSGTNWQTSTTTGDVNCDGNSNSTDAMLIIRYSLGLSMEGTGWCI